MRELVLSPMPHQEEALWDIETPIVGVSGGKRSGKSHVVTVWKSVFLSSLHPGHEFVVASPTYGMTKRNLLPLYRQMSRELDLDIKGLDIKNPEWLEIKWGDKTSILHLAVSIEDYGRMNGMSLAGVFADEMDKTKTEWAMAFAEEALIRLSKPYPGRTAQLHFTGAPEMNGFMGEYFVENASEDKKLYKWSMLDNYMISDVYKQRILNTIPKNKQRAWVYGELMVNTDDIIYAEYDPDLNDTELTLHDVLPTDKVQVTWDLNDGGTSVVIGIRRGPKMYIVEEWMGMRNTKEVLEKVKKQPWSNQAIVSCDPACTQVYPYIVESKLQHQIMRAAPEISHRITAVQTKFCATKLVNGKLEDVRSLFINKRKCPVLRKCLIRQTYVNGEPDKKTFIPEAKTDISGPLDALGYMVFKEFPYNPNGARPITFRL